MGVFPEFSTLREWIIIEVLFALVDCEPGSPHVSQRFRLKLAPAYKRVLVRQTFAHRTLTEVEQLLQTLGILKVHLRE